MFITCHGCNEAVAMNKKKSLKEDVVRKEKVEAEKAMGCVATKCNMQVNLNTFGPFGTLPVSACFQRH